MLRFLHFSGFHYKGDARYDFGLFETPGGPLYVNVGTGTYCFPWRFNCRPELTLVTM